ncbi:S1C family serine protease [Flaviflexus massiliensis]|uniref:S1C family serine protease n=1 Tax=Flaviflexus massiliensis TaxID=1522309 RepID=UPI0006D556DC|nr:trypsin-like peptidase domain-containing protein [Flaviflexus massiliensis]
MNDKEFERWNASGNLGGDGAMNGEGSDHPVSDRNATPGTTGGAYDQSNNPGSGTPASLGNTSPSTGHPGPQTPNTDRGAFDTQRFAPRPEGSLPSSAGPIGPRGASSAQQAPAAGNQTEFVNTFGPRQTCASRPTPSAGSAPMAQSAPASGGAPYASFGSHPNDRYRGYGGNHAPQQAPERRKGVAGVAALALVAGLVGGAGGAGLIYGLTEPHTDAAVSSETQTEIRTVASDGGVNWAQIADEVQPSVVAIEVRGQGTSSTGSGVILDTDGHILTNHHVIAGAQQIQVTLSNGQIIPAEVVGSDASTDLAVIKLTTVPEGITPATFGTSDDLVVGEPVVAIGNPLGLSSTVTTGIISALDRPVVTEGDEDAAVVTNAIQIDAAINPGNSGGPLFNASGEVIGINSSIASLSSMDGGSAGSIGLGFAIPIDLVTRVVDDLMDDGQVDHAFIGVTTSSQAVETENGTRVGAQVVEVSPGSPAEQAGIEVGDSILSINGDQLPSNTALTGYVRQYSPGETITLQVFSGGSTREIELVLGTRE